MWTPAAAIVPHKVYLHFCVGELPLSHQVLPLCSFSLLVLSFEKMKYGNICGGGNCRRTQGRGRWDSTGYHFTFLTWTGSGLINFNIFFPDRRDTHGLRDSSLGDKQLGSTLNYQVILLLWLPFPHLLYKCRLRPFLAVDLMILSLPLSETLPNSWYCHKKSESVLPVSYTNSPSPKLMNHWLWKLVIAERPRSWETGILRIEKEVLVLRFPTC